MARVIGIDVGGPRKGFHAALLDDLHIVERLRTADIPRLVDWCVANRPAVVAVDAPCRWRAPSPAQARAAERALAAQRISCYYAPTEQRAREHVFYSWMLPGADLFAALQRDFPLYLGVAHTSPASIETFPQAVACALAGRVVSAKQKRVVRRELLVHAGIALTGDESMDDLDALLCALAARAFARKDFIAHGDLAGGYIVVPNRSSR